MLYPFIPEKTATMRDMGGCCCPGDCSFESRLQQVCISHFSKMFAFVYATLEIKLKIECNQIKQYLCNVSEMAYILQGVRIRDYTGILTLQMDKGNLKKYIHSIQDTSITISL